MPHRSDEDDRRLGGGNGGQRAAAACVAVHLGDNHRPDLNTLAEGQGLVVGGLRLEIENTGAGGKRVRRWLIRGRSKCTGLSPVGHPFPETPSPPPCLAIFPQNGHLRPYPNHSPFHTPATKTLRRDDTWPMLESMTKMMSSGDTAAATSSISSKRACGWGWGKEGMRGKEGVIIIQITIRNKSGALKTDGNAHGARAPLPACGGLTCRR